jgi:hypothetical protein
LPMQVFITYSVFQLLKAYYSFGENASQAKNAKKAAGL